MISKVVNIGFSQWVFFFTFRQSCQTRSKVSLLCTKEGKRKTYSRGAPRHVTLKMCLNIFLKVNNMHFSLHFVYLCSLISLALALFAITSGMISFSDLLGMLLSAADSRRGPGKLIGSFTIDFKGSRVGLHLFSLCKTCRICILHILEFFFNSYQGKLSRISVKIVHVRTS